MKSLKRCEACLEECPQAQMAHDSAMGHLYATKDLAKFAPYWDGLFDDSGNPTITPDRLRELAQADRDGKALILPCKVGDVVYRIWRTQGREPEITSHCMTDYGIIVRWMHYFGKIVFLTYEEAEAALYPCENCMSGSYRGCDGCGHADKAEAVLEAQEGAGHG